MKNINPKKAAGPDKIQPKIVRLSVNFIDSHLMNIVNNDLSKNYFSNDEKPDQSIKRKVATKLKITDQHINLFFKRLRKISS